MPNLTGMVNKFLVLKHNDAIKYLNDKDKSDYNYIAHKIEKGREKDGKQPSNIYLVINTDEPYAEEVIGIMKRHGHWG